MSFQSGIFNSTRTTLTPDGLVRGDKAVDAAFLARIFSSFFEDGIFLDREGGGFQTRVMMGTVGDVTAMTVVTSPGACHIRGRFGFDDEALQYTFPVSSGEQVFCHVIRLDLEAGEIGASWRVCREQGNLLVTADGEILPVRSDAVFELVTAKVVIPGGCIALRTEHITDLRQDRRFCGFVAGAVTGFDTAAWCVQMQAYLDALRGAADALPGDSVSYLTLHKLDADLGNLAADCDAGALARLAGSHVHPASSIGAGVLNPSVVASEGSDHAVPRLRNIFFDSRLPDSGAGIGEGVLLGVYA